MLRHRAAYLPDDPRTPVEAWWLAAVVVVGIAVRVFFLFGNAGLTPDSPIYLRMADSLAAGRPAIEPAHHGYPTLIAGAAQALPGNEWPGRIVSLICGVLLVPVVHGLARTVASRRWAWLAAVLVALHPMLVAYSGTVAPDALFVLMVSIGLLMVATSKFTSGGLWLGLGYVVRPEALWIAPTLALFSREVRGALAVLIAFAAVAIPYAGYLRLERGHWSIAPQAVVTAADTAHSPAEPAPPANGAPAHPPATGYVGGLLHHAARLVEEWPWPVLLLSLFGLVMAPGPLIAPLVALPLLPLMGGVADGRFLMVMLPSLAAYAALAPGWVVDRWPRAKVAGPAVAAVALAGLVLCWVGPAGHSARAFVGGPKELRAAGRWLRDHGRAGATVMDRQTYVPYFANMRRVPVPEGSLDTILEQAQAAGVDYLVVEDNVAGFDPRLAPLFADGSFRNAERRLRMVHEVRLAPLKGVMLFELVRGDSAAVADSTRSDSTAAAAP
jgi:hypothetical protein